MGLSSRCFVRKEFRTFSKEWNGNDNCYIGEECHLLVIYKEWGHWSNIKVQYLPLSEALISFEKSRDIFRSWLPIDCRQTRLKIFESDGKVFFSSPFSSRQLSFFPYLMVTIMFPLLLMIPSWLRGMLFQMSVETEWTKDTGSGLSWQSGEKRKRDGE